MQSYRALCPRDGATDLYSWGPHFVLGRDRPVHLTEVFRCFVSPSKKSPEYYGD
jgi:hypothetical protein